MQQQGTELKWYIAAAAIAAAAGAAVVVSGWLVVGGFLALGGLAWLILTHPRNAVIASTLIAGAALLAVPIMRVSSADSGLRMPILALVSALAVVAFIRSKAKIPGWPCAAVLGLLAVGTVANLRAADPYQWSSLGVLVLIAFAGLAFGSAVASVDALRPVYAGVIYASLAASALAVVEFLTEMEPLWRGGRVLSDGQSVAMRSDLLPGYVRAQATFGHPLILAAVLLVAVALALGSDVFAKRSTRWLVVALLAAGILASGSRNAAVLLALLLIAMAGKRAFRGWLPRLVFFGVPFAIIGFALFASEIASALASGSFTHRFGSISVLPQYAFGRDTVGMLFGDGAASTPRLLRSGFLQSDNFLAVDNQFMLALVQFGLLGFLAFAAVTVVAFRRARGLSRILIALFAAQCFIFDLLAWPAVALMLWFTIGTIAAETQKKRETPESSPLVASGEPVPSQ